MSGKVNRHTDESFDSPSLAEGVRGWVKIQPILNLFCQICEIPHPSGQTSILQNFLVDFLKSCDCKIQTDSAGNIHAFKGKPHIIFQAHYDMVLVGEKIAPFVENGTLKSRDSSLGADNGIAVALLLHFAKTRTNIEILLTNDEEIGMIGANNIALQTRSKTMINLDSECVNEICVGCAGGFDADISLGAFAIDSAPNMHEFYELTAHNFKGGHSGIDIDKNIPNAIVELLWNLESLREIGEFEILEICGGEARNSIPINAKAVIALGNSSLTRPSRELEKFSFDRQTALSQSNFSTQPTNLTQDTRIAENFKDSSLRETQCESKQSTIKLNPCDSTESRPLRGAKNRIQTSSSASADFLLEAEKRGTPPKSEKRQLLARRGSGAGGAALLRKDSSESKEQNDENLADSHLQNCDSYSLDLRPLDSSLRASRFAQNDESTPHIALKKLESYTLDSRQNPLPSTIIPYLLRLHNGVYEIQSDSVTSSLNFSLISNECLKIMVRANSDEFLHRHKSRLQSLFGENVAFGGFYSAWERESNEDSPILAQLQTLYAKHKIAHKIVQIHAGLECGILKQKCALHEVISIGPTILHPHSKSESLDLESVRKIYDILCDLIPK